MGKKLFRYMFENSPNAIVLNGCMWDKRKNDKMLYIYSSELKKKKIAAAVSRGFHSKGMIDLFIMGEFTLGDCRRLLYRLHHNGVKKVILPYSIPEKRMQLYEQIERGEPDSLELHRFIQDPDRYLKEASIQEYYFIVGNGNENLGLEEGVKIHLEQHSELLSRIISIEGKELPVREAGWFVQNQMFFYLSDCGQEFGSSKLALFCAPVEDDARQMDSVFQAVIFDSKQNCHMDMSEDDCKCAIKCMLYQDHGVFRHSKARKNEKMRLGVFVSGDIFSVAQMDNLSVRLQSYLPMIRTTALTSEDYGRRLLKEIAKHQETDELYCICPKDSNIAQDFLQEMMIQNPRNRLVGLSERYGCCLNGYLSAKEDIYL